MYTQGISSMILYADKLCILTNGNWSAVIISKCKNIFSSMTVLKTGYMLDLVITSVLKISATNKIIPLRKRNYQF